MAKIVKKPVAPIYAVAVLWVVWGLLFPLHKPIHFILAAIASVAVFCIGKVIWPDKTYNTPDPEPAKEQPKTTGNPEIDALIKERDRAVSEMRRLNDSNIHYFTVHSVLLPGTATLKRQLYPSSQHAHTCTHTPPYFIINRLDIKNILSIKFI